MARAACKGGEGVFVKSKRKASKMAVSAAATRAQEADSATLADRAKSDRVATKSEPDLDGARPREQAERTTSPGAHGARLAALMRERRALLVAIARIDRQIEQIASELEEPADVVPTEVERRRARKVVDRIFAKIGGR